MQVKKETSRPSGPDLRPVGGGAREGEMTMKGGYRREGRSEMGIIPRITGLPRGMGMISGMAGSMMSHRKKNVSRMLR